MFGYQQYFGRGYYKLFMKYEKNKFGGKLEKEIQREICDWLAGHKYFFWRQNSTPIFDPRKNVFRAMPKYTPRGLPDIIILYRARFIGLEVKSKGYWKYTDDQQAMKEKIRDNGGFYEVVISLEEAQLALKNIEGKIGYENFSTPEADPQC